jgi:hypothetical protein
MQSRHAYGLAAAVLLGMAAGFMLAPDSGRREARRRTVRNLSAMERIAARNAKSAAGTACSAMLSAAHLLSAAFQLMLGPLSFRRRPLARLKEALAADPALGRRHIWVDAYGDTILLHGIVEDDEEWRSADLLARLASPDGSVRNLLQVRRSLET